MNIHDTITQPKLKVILAHFGMKKCQFFINQDKSVELVELTTCESCGNDCRKPNPIKLVKGCATHILTDCGLTATRVENELGCDEDGNDQCNMCA